MPHVRSRGLATGRFWYFVQSDKKEIPCGQGVLGKERAHRKLAAAIKNAYEVGLGFEGERECVWSLRDLRKADLIDARRRGLRTVEKPFQGRKPYRVWHWDTLADFFGADTPLDEVTPERIRQFIAYREKAVSAATINRDLAVLRSALALARETDESGYSRDPFRRVRALKEVNAAPIALSERQLAGLVRACWKRHPPLGAYVELLALTSSRLNDPPAAGDGSVDYGPQKRGNPRSFRATRRVNTLLRAPRSFNRAIWREVVRELGMPGLTPHHLRHTSITLAAAVPGASLLSLMARAGWKRPETAARYLHPGREPLDVLKLGRRNRNGTAAPQTKSKKRKGRLQAL